MFGSNYQESQVYVGFTMLRCERKYSNDLFALIFYVLILQNIPVLQEICFNHRMCLIKLMEMHN